MSFEILVSDNFRRRAKQLSKKHPSLKNDLETLAKQLILNPETGISLGNNLYKIRMAISSKGRGKSGGARVITCVVYHREQILLADIYDKAQYDTIDELVILKNLRSEGFSV